MNKITKPTPEQYKEKANDFFTVIRNWLITSTLFALIYLSYKIINSSEISLSHYMGILVLICLAALCALFWVTLIQVLSGTKAYLDIYHSSKIYKVSLMLTLIFSSMLIFAITAIDILST